MRKTRASSLIHISQFYKMFIFNHSVRVGWKQRALVFSVKVSNANPVSTWISERLTLPSTVYCRLFIFFFFFVFFFFFFFFLFLFVILFFFPAYTHFFVVILSPIAIILIACSLQTPFPKP